ncbi:conjugal transfer protein [Mycolicibacterium goodii]|uniref:conjugal transfer protein n=1 Tax=Mycolicibacterium goodii TaxID=134601 RepID=UPI001BDCA7B1|nr:conjugal transfer protein [Mycolicibacterium goodii]MBU8820963.1 conjugal transfer protein [Mycolicibacterium goodii]
MLRFLDPSRNRYAGLIFAAFVMCGPVALIVAGWAAWSSHSKQPMSTASYIGLNTTAAQIELFADQVVRLSLTGVGEQSRKTLASMVVDPRAVSLADDPWNVTSTHVKSIRRVAEEAESAEWEVEVEVGYSAPGSGMIQFGNLVVNVLSSNGAYKATALPRFRNPEVRSMQVGPGYTNPVDVNTALGKTISNFANAYFVPGASQDLGRYVTGSFSEKPLAATPFSSATVQSILSRDALPPEAAPGDTADLLVTIRGGASQSTWYTMQVPLRARVTDQNQWAVSDILETVDVGKIIHR